ncbi:hypothetical protein BST81_08665 [Leptolyngbya sp. 'hensonii']|nr:hypothetical protein BST81_08665 [Leptolyngbya sp. 'hensonii']
MLTRFTSSQTVDIAVAEQPVPIQHYLRQPQRLVNALVDPSRIELLGNDRYRLKLRPLSFLAFNLQPTVDLQVWTESQGTVHLRSVSCEIRGIEYINQRFNLNLVGKLQPHLVNGAVHLLGRADLEVQVELPPTLWLTPRPLLEAAGNSLLKSVLLTIKQRLMHQLVSDYYRWVASTSADAAVFPGASALPAR